MNTFTFADFKAFQSDLYQGKVTPEHLKEVWHKFRASQEALKVELKGWKKNDFTRYFYASHVKASTKEKLINSMIWMMRNEFEPPDQGESENKIYIIGFEEPKKVCPWDAIENKLDNWTDEAIAEVVRKEQERLEKKAKRFEARQKALNNPETLDEYDLFVQVKGLDALNDEQLPIHDRLLTDVGRTRRQLERERKAIIRATQVEADLTLVETIHTKKQIPLWVVKLSERIDSDKFKELKIRARQLDGYYSNFRGNGAIPGFTFTQEEKAQKFISLDQIDGKERLEQKEKSREQKAVDNILALADALKAEAQESLSRERLANTYRRARMASNAEASACRDFQLAGTMRRIARGIMEAEVKYLDRLYHKVEFEDLESLLSSAQHNAVQAKHKANPNLSYQEREGDRFRSPQMSDIDHAEFPYPVLHLGTIQRLIEMGKKTSGCKLIAARLQKNCLKPNVRDWGYRFETETGIKDLKTLCHKLWRYKSYEVDEVKERILRYDRMIRLDITRLPELRTALREYLQLRGTKKTVSLEVTLDRSLIGLRIPGYFPTSKAISQKMVEEAQLEPHHLCLEPNIGGKANLAEAIRKVVGNNNLHACEINYTLREVAIKKGFILVEHNFLDLVAVAKYDRILANPPFENHQDYYHLLKMWECLKEDGRIVCVIGASTANWDTFKHWLDLVGGSIEKLPEGCFKDHNDVSQTTGTQAYLVVVDKPVSVVSTVSAIAQEPINETLQPCKPVQLSLFEKEHPAGIQLSLF